MFDVERGKQTENAENIFFKALASRFWLTSKSCLWFMADFLSNGFRLKGNNMLLKVDKMNSLLRKPRWKWSMVNRKKKRGIIKTINGSYT